MATIDEIKQQRKRHRLTRVCPDPTPDPTQQQQAQPVDVQAWGDFADTADDLGTPLGAPGPQLLTGEGIIQDPPVGAPGGSVVGVVTTYFEPGGWGQPDTWNEIWDMTDPGTLNDGFRAAYGSPLPAGFDGPAFAATPPPAGTARAHLVFAYEGPPTAVQINALAPVPPGAVELRLNVYIGAHGGPAAYQAGRLYRVIGPTGEVTDFWSLWSNYQRPTLNLIDMWTGPDTDPITGSQSLVQFLQSVPPDASFVHVPYQWVQF